MNSRERLLTALAHKEPDRVPVDLGSTPSSNISAIAYNNLKRKLGVSSEKTRVYDICQQVVLPDMELLDRFGVDVLDVAQSWNTSSANWQTVTLSDGSQAEYPAWFRFEERGGGLDGYSQDGVVIGRMPQGATFFDQCVFPYLDGYPSDYNALGKAMSLVSWQGFAHAPWDHASEADFWPKLREKAQDLKNSSGKALMLVCGCNLFEWGTFLRRIDNFLMDLIEAPSDVEKLLDALMEGHMATLAKACEYVGDVVDIIRFGDDLGTDHGSFMSPETYRRFFKPRHKMLCDYVKKHSSMHTFLHTCGSIYNLMPDLIEAGYEVLNPIQTSARNMEPERLKAEFGKDVVFWGAGVDTRSILNNAAPQDVKEDVKRRLEILMPGGGYVFNTIHNIMPDCPPENVLAMFEAVEEFGKY